MTRFDHADDILQGQPRRRGPLGADAARTASRPPPRRHEARPVSGSYEVEIPRTYDLVCLSHLRWDVGLQRPQYLLSRFARGHRVFFVEEPIFDADTDRLECSARDGGVIVATPHLRAGMAEDEIHARQRLLLNGLFRDRGITNPVLWYDTPMAMPFTSHLFPTLVVYDGMDELSAFDGVAPGMCEREQQLLAWADLVFTSGHGLDEAKRGRHDHVSEQADAFQCGSSWDRIQADMQALIDAAIAGREVAAGPPAADAGCGRVARTPSVRSR